MLKKQQFSNKLLFLVLMIPLFSFSQDSERILEIRTLYAQIINDSPYSTNTVSWSESEEEHSLPLERTFVYSYFDDNLSKLECEIRQDHSWISAEYYFEDNELFFVFLTYDFGNEEEKNRLYFTKAGEIEKLLVNSGKGNVELSDENKIYEIKQVVFNWLAIGNARLKNSDKLESNIVFAKGTEEEIESVEVSESESAIEKSSNLAAEENELLALLKDSNHPLFYLIGIGILIVIVFIFYGFSLGRSEDKEKQKRRNKRVYGDENGPPDGWRAAKEEEAKKINSTIGYTAIHYNSLTDEKLLKELQERKKSEENKKIINLKHQKRKEIVRQEKEAEFKRLRREKLRFEKAEQERNRKLIKEYGEVDGDRLFNSEIWLGMTKSMLIKSRGEPADKDETVYKTKTKVEYFYSPYVTRQKNTRYKFRVDLENDVIVGWKDMD